MIGFLLVYPLTNEIYNASNRAHPYIMGFVKVSILDTMGEVLALRIVTGDYKRSVGMIYKFIVWDKDNLARLKMLSLKQ